MAFGGRELRLILSIQSYGTGNIQRLRRDIAALGTATDIANKKQMLQARLARQAIGVSRAAQELRDVRAGIPFYNARNKAMTAWGRANAGVLSTQARQIGVARQLFDVETERQVLSRKVIAAKNVYGASSEDIRILERGFQSLDMQEASLTLSTKALNTQLAIHKTALVDADLAYKKLVRDTGLESAATKEASAALAEKTAAYNTTAAAAERLAVAERLQRTQRAEIAARTVAHIGRTAQFAGLIGLAGVSLAASSFANFNKQLVLAATQARDIDAPFSQVATRATQLQHGFDQAGQHFEGILELMNQFPASGEEMATAAYDIYSSMRINFGQGFDLLKAFNQLAVATGSDLATATNAGITVLNNFGKSTRDVNGTLNLMMSTVRFGRMHLEEFNAMLNKIAPAAVAAGQGFEDVAGAMALLTTRQPSQQISATGIARLLQTFRDPDFMKGAANFGADLTKGSKAVGALKPLPQIIEEMNEHFGLFIKQGGASQLFKQLTAVGHETGVGRQSRIESANAYVLLIRNIEDYRALQKSVTGDTKEFAKALAAMSAAPGVQWAIFINKMKAFVLTIGEAALPVLLKLSVYIERAVNWFRNLSKHTQDTIVKWTVLGSVGLLVGGTILSIVGSLVALILNLKLATAGSVLLSGGLSALMGIGIIAIPIVLQLIKGGEPGLWDFLGGAVSGALGGFLIGGLPGAAIGALAVPVALQVISDKQQNAEAQKTFKAIAKEIGKNVGENVDWKEMADIQKWVEENPKKVAAINKKWAKRKTKTDAQIQADYLKRVKNFNIDTVKEILGGNAELQKAYDAQNTAQSAAASRSEQIAKAHTQAVKQAMDNMNQKIDSAVDNLASIYTNMRQTNEAGLGQIFGGPTMTGILGSVFGNINDMLRQFGVQIPIPFAILKQDAEQSIMYFKRWREDIDKLIKLGAPKVLIDQFLQEGPSAIPKMEGLLGSPEQAKKLMKEIADATTGPNSLLDQATKKDLKRQLTYWESFGKSAAYQMVRGLNSGLDANQLYLKASFKKYVVDTFGSILNKEMAAEIAAAMKDAIANLPKITAPGAPGGSGGPGGKLTQAQKDALAFKTPIKQLTQAQTRRQFILSQRRVQHMWEGGVTPAERQRMHEEMMRQLRLRRHWEAMRRKSGLPSRRFDPHTGGYTGPKITINEGDKFTIHADGANPHNIQRGFNKAGFQKKHKIRAGRTGGGT